MFNVRLAGGHLYGKQLFTWLSLVVSLMASFVLSFFPLDVLDEIWNLIESVSEGFLTYSWIHYVHCLQEIIEKATICKDYGRCLLPVYIMLQVGTITFLTIPDNIILILHLALRTLGTK